MSGAAAGPAGAPASAAVAVDVAVFTVRDGSLHVLLAQARSGPFAGWWALPGGRVGEEESLDEAAARRAARAYRGARRLPRAALHLRPAARVIPRGRVVSVAYVGLVADPERVTGAAPDKYAGVAWRPVSRLPPLAYDHATVVRLAVTRLRAKLAVHQPRLHPSPAQLHARRAAGVSTRPSSGESSIVGTSGAGCSRSACSVRCVACVAARTVPRRCMHSAAAGR